MFELRTKDYLIYWGRDKHENEELIQWGWPEDVWFHADGISSAHVYVRCLTADMDAIPERILELCSQITKQNSIEGSKRNSLRIVYTPWSNLVKTADMDVGAVGFRDSKERRFRLCTKDKEMLKQVRSKTKDVQPDLESLRHERDRLEREAAKAERRRALALEAEDRARRQEEARIRSYDGFFDDAPSRCGASYEEDFM